jgi:hypothetical protein
VLLPLLWSPRKNIAESGVGTWIGRFVAVKSRLFPLYSVLHSLKATSYWSLSSWKEEWRQYHCQCCTSNACRCGVVPQAAICREVTFHRKQFARITKWMLLHYVCRVHRCQYYSSRCWYSFCAILACGRRNAARGRWRSISTTLKHGTRRDKQSFIGINLNL